MKFSLTRKGFTISLLLILVFATFTRFYRLGSPKTYYFDEVYHGVTSKLIARNDPRAYEWWNEPVEPNTAVDWLHPPLAKYTQAFSMRLWGENSFGWRFSSAVFGVLTVALTALLAHIYFHKRGLTLLAALLSASDGLLLTQSRIAMNDIHVTFFILLTITLYGVFRAQLEKKRPYLWLLATGISAGLAMGSKWSGVFVLLAIWLAEIVRASVTRQQLAARLKHVARTLVLLGLVPVLIYLASYTHMFLQGKTLVCTGNQVKQGECYCSQDSSTWVRVLSVVVPSKKSQFEALEARGGCKRLISHFSELHHQILWYQTHLSATHPYQSRPWQWVLDLKPVWMHVDYEQSDRGTLSHVYNAGNPLLFLIGIVSVIFISLKFLAQKRPWQIGVLLLTYFIVWAPWNFSPRIMFFYHYAPAVPILAVLIAFLFAGLWKQVRLTRALIASLVILMVLAFVLLYPVNSGVPVPSGYFDVVFSLFPAWK